jgi:hypothetical protein
MNSRFNGQFRTQPARTDAVIFGTLKPYGDHFHLEFVCADCGSLGFVGGTTLQRIICDETEREFFVIGLPAEYVRF